MAPALPSPRLLVGRTRELVELTRALEAATQGEGTTLLVRGEAGIGKSRLCEETARLARAHGFTLGSGRCWETPGAPPHWPWLQLLDELDADVPELRQWLSGEGPTSAPELQRLKVSQAMTRVLRERAKAPLLLVFEDLHAADLPTLHLLHVTIRSLKQAPVVWLLTARLTDARLTDDVEAVLSRLAREGTVLRPQPLDAAQVAELASAALGRPLTPDVVLDVARTTEGTPLFVEGALRLLQTGNTERRLPHGAHDVLRDKLEHLPPSSLTLLELAAVIGRSFSRRILSLATGHTAEELQTLLQPAVAAGVLEELSAEQLRFSHALLREAQYERIALTTCAELHLRVFGALRASGAAAHELAHHALSAWPLVDETSALTVLHEAADRSEATLAFQRSAELLERALAVVDVSRASPRRAELLLRWSRALGSAGRSAQAIATAERAAADARELADANLLARAALASGAVFRLGSVDSGLVRLLEEAIRALGASAPETTVVLRARLAAALQPADDPAGPIQLAHEAVAAARRLASPSVLTTTLHFALSALGDLTDASEREPLLRELVGLAEEANDRVLEHRTRLRLAVALYELGEFELADACAARLEGPSMELGPSFRIRALYLRSMRLVAAGRFGESDQVLGDVDRQLELVEPREFEVTRHIHRLFRLVVEGRTAESLAALEPWRALTAGTLIADQGVDHALCAHVAAAGGELELARRELSLLPPVVLDYPDRGVSFLLAMALGRTGDAARASRVGRQLAKMQQPFASHGLIGMSLDGPMAWAHGWVEHAQGNLAAARTLFDEALGRCESVGAHGVAALIRKDRASLGTAPAPIAPAASIERSTLALRRDGEGWALEAGAEVVRLKDSRGLQMLAVLMERPRVEVHVLELSGSDASADSPGSEVLDATARAEYRQRVGELTDELEEAERFNDRGRAERLSEELDFLRSELGAQLGLGGASRKTASNAERARSNVQRRIKDALARIEELSPSLGKRLARSVKTGLFCSYDPLD